MRLDLGLLQMEMDGRPDGRRPHGCPSLLEYHLQRLEQHRQHNGTELGFHLTPGHCQALRAEALMYYNRYLSLFVLGEYEAVARDTARNLRVLDLCGRYAIDERDQLVLEQYRPYILMMHARAVATLEMDNGNYAIALRVVKRALASIKAFFERFHQGEAYKHANEVRLLRQFAREIRARLPANPLRELKRSLQQALEHEKYEEAARLRDEIARMEKQG
jgi:hypothetical protein